MFNISDYLKKFAKIEGDSTALREAVTKVLRDSCGIENIPFELKKGVVHIKGSPAERSVVFMKKQDILRRLSEGSLTSKIYEVR